MRKVRLAAGLGGLLLLATPVRAEGDFFPFSVWYGGGKARAPMLEPVDDTSRSRWKKDLEQIRSLGFNSVRTWVEWTAGEPRPGSYHFENLELLMELAGEVGLKVLIQVYVDSAPDWVGRLYPEARFVAHSGAVIESQAAPGFCFDHPEVRRRILDFYREAARVASRHPHFLGWDLWSEPHIINWAIIDFVPNATFCYCPSSRLRFSEWLKEKYGSLERLNEAWYRTFSDWEEVSPPRFGTILSYTDFVDWRVFILQKLAEDLALRAEAVRNVDATPVVTSHAAVPCLFTSPLWGVGAPDDWLMADSVDFWGTSIYPKHSFPERHWDLQRLSVIFDFIRGSGRKRRGFYIGELQAGMGIRGTVVGDPITPEDHRLWVWGALSRGARAVNVYAYYPMSSGYEAGGYGLVDLDGTLTERSRRIGDVAATVDRHARAFLQGQPPAAKVALIYNPLSHFVGGEQHLSEAGAVRDSLIGIYRAFWRRNIPVDFVHLREVEEGELSRYRVAFLPYPLMLTETAAERLGSFVRTGGTLVAEARLAWNDERGYSQEVIPGFGLDRVFRVREGALRMEREVAIQITGAGPLLGELKEGDLLTGRGIREELIPYEGAQILANFSDGKPALTSSRYGNGHALAVGSFLGMANAQNPDPNTEAFFLGVARAAGVQPLLEVGGVPADAFVEVRMLEGPEARILFLFNHSARTLSARLPLVSGVNLESEAEENLSELSLGPGEIRVYRIPPSE